MGMDISAKLIYGLRYKDLVEEMDDDAIELLDAEIYDGMWDSCNPWYDAPLEVQFVGIQMGEYIDVDGIPLFIQDLRECEDRFKTRFGKTGYAIAMQHVY